MKILDLFSNRNTDNKVFTKPYIIAEAGVNHEGSMDNAKRLIDEAQEGGAEAIKFQSYKAETIAIKESPSYWDLREEPTTSQFELFKKHDSFWKNEFESLKRYSDSVGIEFMSTPFDKESATFLNDLMDVYKISSSDITNKPFIEFICSFNKPIILSTGASYLYEIQEAVEWIDKYNLPLSLMHCVLNYPTKDKNANLGMILDLKDKFKNKIIGYSDHTLPSDMKVCELSYLLGAKIIEKHFTFDKKLKGNDHYHSMDMNDLKVFNKQFSSNFEIIGPLKITSLSSENISRDNARRSLVSTREIQVGEIIKSEDLTFKRPAHGISPRYFNEVIGKKVEVLIKKDSALKWNHLN